MATSTKFLTTWHKSSYSGSDSNCVEVAFGWRKSSYSGNDANCVEIARVDHVVGIRDSKNPAAGHLAMNRHSFTNFLTALKDDKLPAF